MNHPILTALFAFFVLSTATFAQQTSDRTLTHDGLEREYILHVPASYDPDTPAPLLFCFHGLGITANLNMIYTNFKAIADTAGFILIHPQGTKAQGLTHWNVGGFTAGSTVDDVGFTESLLETISNEFNINPNKVYSTGMSNGGYMSFLLACQLSDKFAAVASVTGSMTPETFDECNPQHSTPILQIHGDSDETVPYDGNPDFSKSINQVLEYWIDFNSCNFPPTITAIEDIDTSDGSTVEQNVYSGGNNGVSVEHFKVFGGGHDWPGAFGNMDINASMEVWKFLSRYSLNDLTETVGINDIDKLNINIYPNPSSAFINIEGDFPKPVNFEIVSTLGKTVMTGEINSDQKTIDLSHLANNLYFLKIGNTSYKILKKD